LQVFSELADILFCAPPGNCFDTPQTGTDAAFADDMEETDLPGGANVRTAAQFKTDRRLADFQTAHDIPVFFIEEGRGTLLYRFGIDISSA